jgi:NADH dehydrogenase/NADH:ubiquinone oxidoreductase subunit G
LGALTLKSFPFELRGWDVENYESIDPTDGFGSNTRVYVSKDQIVQIEPDYNSNSSNSWITDKGRQFFDGIFNIHTNKQEKYVDPWFELTQSLTKMLYIFDHVNQHKSQNFYFIVIFGNLGIESLSFLTLMTKKYSFLKVKKAENIKINNDLETHFQLNLASNKIKLNSSSLCLIISTNPRYEGYYLNLNLRQRFLKGNFKCFIIGSLIDLTFPTVFLGSNLSTLKTISEGTNLVCRNIKSSKNPITIVNSELLKRNDGQNSLEMLKILKYANLFSKTWQGYNLLAPNLSETSSQNIYKFPTVTLNDFNYASSLYFLNININNNSNLKQIAELKLLDYFTISKNNLFIDTLFLDQSFISNKNFSFINKIYAEKVNYNYLPCSMFYENEETFITTEGLIKRTNKLILKKKTKNTWQIFRKMFNQFQELSFLNYKTNQTIFFNNKKLVNFKNFIYFQYQATQSLTNLNFYLSTKTQPFNLNNLNNIFKSKTYKIKNTKLKYWLDDFFISGKDEYSQNSSILTNCSKVFRVKQSNFF